MLKEAVGFHVPRALPACVLVPGYIRWLVVATGSPALRPPTLPGNQLC